MYDARRFGWAQGAPCPEEDTVIHDFLYLHADHVVEALVGMIISLALIIAALY